jgi:hypothetical protein
MKVELRLVDDPVDNIETEDKYNENETHRYDSGDEDGSDSYSSDSERSTDAKNELEKMVEENEVNKKNKRGLTRVPKLRSAYTNSGGKKHRVKFDALESFTGKYRAEFISFLGDLVREKVGLSVFN